MALTDREMAVDLWCFDHPDVPNILAPVEYSLADIRAARARIAVKRKAMVHYDQTASSEIKRQAEERDWASLGERIQRAENASNAMRTLYLEAQEEAAVDQLVAWLAGALTGGAIIYTALVSL